MAGQHPIFGEDEFKDWELTLRLDSIAAFRRFLISYPESQFRIIALKREEELKEEKMWKKALRLNNIFSYETYLQYYPSGKYVEEAGQKIEAIEHLLAWEEACKKNTVSAYLNYKTTYPEGTFVEEAIERITLLVKKSRESKVTANVLPTVPDNGDEEEKDLENATAQDSVAAYNTFLKKHPEGKYVSQVKNRIRQLEKKLARQYRTIEEELVAWEYADVQDSLLSYRDFLNRFPSGRFAGLARERIALIQDRLKEKVRVGNGEPEVTPTDFSPVQPTEERIQKEEAADRTERNRMGIRLSFMWLIGFGLLAGISFVLAKFLYPVSLISGIMVGAYFVYHRGERITKTETEVYLIGAGLGVFFLLKGFLQLFADNTAVLYSISAATGLVTYILLKVFFKKIPTKD